MLISAIMKLSTYLAEQDVTPTEFASKLGVTTQAVHLWATDQRVPRREIMKAISIETAGTVTANDFFEPAP